MGREPAVQQVLRARRHAAASSRTSRRSRSRCSRCSTTSGATYSLRRSSRRHGRDRATQPWFLYHCTRGAHFDNYPHETFLGSSPAKHPYKDTIIELDDIVGRLVAELEETGQLDDTIDLPLVGQRPRDGDVARRRVHAVPLRQGLDVGGRQRVPGIVCWPGMIEPDQRQRRPVLASWTCSRRCCAWPAPTDAVPDDRYIDGVDQTSFLLGDDAALEPASSSTTGSANTFSAVRCRRVQVHARVDVATTTATSMNSAASAASRRSTRTAGSTTSTWIPKEQHSYMIRKLSYLDTFTAGIGKHLRTFAKFPPKVVVGGVG